MLPFWLLASPAAYLHSRPVLLGEYTHRLSAFPKQFPSVDCGSFSFPGGCWLSPFIHPRLLCPLPFFLAICWSSSTFVVCSVIPSNVFHCKLVSVSVSSYVILGNFRNSWKSHSAVGRMLRLRLGLWGHLRQCWTATQEHHWPGKQKASIEPFSPKILKQVQSKFNPSHRIYTFPQIFFLNNRGSFYFGIMILCFCIKGLECTTSLPRVLSSPKSVAHLHRNIIMSTLTQNRQDLILPTGRIRSHLMIPG